MKRKNILILIFMFLLYTLTFSEITVKISEPIRFKDLNTKSLGEDYIVGEGAFEVSTDNEEKDIGKKIIFRFPETGFMTNRKNNIKIAKYAMETEDKSMIISTKREIVKFYALVDRREIGRNKDPKIVEGEYVGYVPIIFSLYEKEFKNSEGLK
ncbi:hypothetical protein [Fusobacterium sp.]|uniref:hypothetical protein n=1 Tax=Fusobacterium sp. TaxID=68766 RepID=UPI0026335287|nr:hypothetical protein [Fusobacterium sp.]